MLPVAGKGSTCRLRSSLLICSRQGLPRPDRLYSTPSKTTQAPALATAQRVADTDVPYVPYSPQKSGPTSREPHVKHVKSFLHKQPSYTIVPTPLPEHVNSPLNDLYFPDARTKDSLAVIDACLHNSYDVLRAQQLFNMLRDKKRGNPLLETQLYNRFLNAYLEMTSGKDAMKQQGWVKEAWALYKVMERGEELVAPNANTYALMLKIWLKFNKSAFKVDEQPPREILQCILDRNIAIQEVVASLTLESEEAEMIVKELSRAAAELGLSKVVIDLGREESLEADPLADVPLVRPVTKLKVVQSDLEAGEQEQEPQYEVPFNLDTVRRHLSGVAFARRVLGDDVAARQKLLEETVFDVAEERWRHEAEKMESLGLSGNLHHAQLQAWMYDWHSKLQERIVEGLAKLREEEDSKLLLRRPNDDQTRKSSPFLSLLKPTKLSLITIMELMRLHGTGGVVSGMKTTRALMTVGKAVELEHKAEVLKRHNVSIPQMPVRRTSYFTRRAYGELQHWREKAQTYIHDATDWSAEWSHPVRVRVGSFLVDCLMDVAVVKRTAVDKKNGQTLTEEQPAFFHSYEYVRGHKLGVILMNPVVADRLAKDELKSTLHPRHLPMLTKPKPWLSYDDGGYLFSQTNVMRFKDTQEQFTYLRQASQLGNLELIYAGLDVLGSTPWKINRPIFDVVLDVWNMGERFGKISPAVFDQPEPEKPTDYDTNQENRACYLQRIKEWSNDKANSHSDRCSVNYRVEIARTFLADTFYIPHNIDFRGRAYPIPPHLSHIGDDLSRGLMTFAEARPLGKSGLRWLKIHLANLHGFDKGSFTERVEFTEKHMDDIFDSAENPLGGRRWWVEADDPWQCLAACMEVRNALKSGNPEGYASSLPVHQDGTCNGLQHYAALGGDARGARQVNLDVSDRPSDVYTHVAIMVEHEVERDAAAGNEVAKLLLGKITRRVVKQTVMTTVYGVTFIGARAQIARQLTDRGDIAAEKIWDTSSYLAKHVLSKIGDLFTGARDIQNYLTLSARLIARSIPESRFGPALPADKLSSAAQEAEQIYYDNVTREQMTSVIWTTPLGLPVVQPYRKLKRKQVMTSMQTVYLQDPNSPAEVHSGKQSSAFPPNFIHSLDATHMMLTALECQTHGITFASVHDSYWTHAATVDQMNEIIRDTFVALHESNVLERLDKEFRERYKGYKVPFDTLHRLGKRLKISDRMINSLEENATPTSAAAADTYEPNTKVELVSIEVEKSAPEVDAETGTDAEAEPDVVQEETAPAKPTRPSKKGEKKLKASDADGPNEAKGATEDDAPAKNISGRKREVTTFNLRTIIAGRSRFVELTDLLPPLPKKGVFDVKTIKDSLYFFS